MTKSKQIQEGMRNQTSSEPTAAATDFVTGPTSVASRKANSVLRAYQQYATSTSQEHSISSLHVKKVSNLKPPRADGHALLDMCRKILTGSI